MRSDFASLSASRVIVSALAILCAGGTDTRAQEPPPTESFSQAFFKANAACKALWADHAFDSLRDKFPLGGENPSMAMLTSRLRLAPKDRPLADLAITAIQKCRALYVGTYTTLPGQTRSRLQGFDREQDSVIAQLYVGKITFGEYNVAISRIAAEISKALFGDVPTAAANAEPYRSTAAEQKTKQSTIPPDPGVAQPNSNRQTRVALVVGNGKYVDLPKLNNPTNDAHAIVDALRDLGFVVTLATDASEETIRRAVRKFADESDQADLAFVFYAGHGAQVDGENYLLPVDMDVPKTKSDIELSALRVDDLVNSIRSPTKIIFLDACRDNPALFKNLVKGRGAVATGLAPADASHLSRIKPGGGVFIAYATDAGSVALEGGGDHSPFTQALLRNLKKPISIDDMFSLVTREVALTTKGLQRPYKYASLENIVCLTGSCSSTAQPPVDDIVQEAQRSESEDLQVALQTNDLVALQSYLTKYPDSSRTSKVLAQISTLKRSQYNEWVLYQISNGRFPQYLRISSIHQFGDRVAVQMRALADPSQPIGPNKYPEGTYSEDTVVFDCKESTLALSDRKAVSPSGEVLGYYKWADPEVLNLALGGTIKPGSVAATAEKLLCDDHLRTPLVTKEQLETMNFSDLASTLNGDGEIYYSAIPGNANSATDKEAIVVIKHRMEQRLSDVAFPSATLSTDLGGFNTSVHWDRVNCAEKKVYPTKSEDYDKSDNLKFMMLYDSTSAVFEAKKLSPFGTLVRILCGVPEVSK